jgi:hypothetical protein
VSEKTIIVCDECGKQAVETVKIATSRGTFERDVCREHLAKLAVGRKPRRGRPKKEHVGMKGTNGTGKPEPTA